MTLVLDCSVALSWCFEDEASPKTDAILLDVAKNGGWVPQLWHLEVSNSLLQGVKRKRLSLADVAEKFMLLTKLPLYIDAETAQQAFDKTYQLANHEHLSAYDAAYLELAIRKQIPLATKDESLAAAAKRNKVRLSL
jgi:predicted nucleic acid-binding protein